MLQATARLDRIHARIADRTLRAPFPGIISSIETLRGESVTTLPVVTLVANNAFNITVRIPEIDITRVQVGQEAHAIFDARPEETIPATVTFIAPIATMIDGVAYFEAVLTFPYNPPWLRGGLNADVDIITETRDKVLRMPKRFLTRTDDTYTVLIPQGVSTTVHTVGVGFSGNDGYVEITGLNEGDTIVAP